MHAKRAEIAAAIRDSPVTIVSGATGSGKSTQLPKICLELGRGQAGMIGHTQPRRIAAQALANRISEELGTAPGDLVGYQVRFVDRTSPRTLVKLMTDGLLLRELEGDPLLERYDTLILDEAHERNLNVDFLLGVCKRLVGRRPELRVIVTSATIETRRFAEFFGGAPVVDVEGRSYPVEIRYRPLEEESADAPSLPEAIGSALDELLANAQGIDGDALVFLPGERQITETRDYLQRGGARDWDVLPLYARLSAPEQQRVFAPHARRRVVLATNVAETSLTIPGVRFVVDTRPRAHQSLQPASQVPAPADRAGVAGQRRAACGPLRPGGRGHLHPPVWRGRLRDARRVHGPGDPAHQPGEPDPADGGARARRARGFPVPRCAGHAPAQRRLPPAAGTERRRRRSPDHAPRPADGTTAGRSAARAHPARGRPVCAA